jgi:hypothetical protein
LARFQLFASAKAEEMIRDVRGPTHKESQPMSVRTLPNVLLAILVGGACAVATGAERELPIRNAGFDEGFSSVPGASAEKISGTVGDGWSDNSDWADVRVEYAADRENQHGGKAAQKIVVTKVASGAVQFVQKIPLVAGKTYAFSVWMRGNAGTMVGMALRKATEPYTHFAAKDVSISDEWQEFVVQGQVTESADGMLLLKLSAPTEVVVDDAKLVEITSD